MLNRPEKTKNAVVAWIRDYFAQFSPEMRAVVGVSGGKDSSVTAALCVEALGRDRVLGVTMPDGEQPDIADSNMLIEHLGIPHIEANIGNVTAALADTLAHAPGFAAACGGSLGGQAQVNMPARVRMTVLYAIAQSLPHGGLVINTCNRSEDYVGYSTKFGDAAGDLSPLANFTVREVLQLGTALGLPPQLVSKAPSDGLSGKTDEDNLGFTYAQLDDYLERGICPDPAVRERIDALHVRNLHKLQLMPSYRKELED